MRYRDIENTAAQIVRLIEERDRARANVAQFGGALETVIAERDEARAERDRARAIAVDLENQLAQVSAAAREVVQAYREAIQ